MRFTRIAFGCTVIEGYGQTEFVTAITITSPGEMNGGTYVYVLIGSSSLYSDHVNMILF